MKVNIMFILLAVLLVAIGATAQDNSKVIPARAKVFINPMNDGFETYLTSALANKHVPLQVVTDKTQAEFEISGTSETKKASTAKKVIRLSWHSNEQASITVTNMKTGESVWAYSVNKQDSAHGKQSTAEACAKHLKEKIESRK